MAIPSTARLTTSGSFAPTLFFDGSAHGLGTNDINALDLPLKPCRRALSIRNRVARAVDRLVEEFVEILGARKRMVVEVGAKGHHDGPDILDLWLLRFGPGGGGRHQNHEREKDRPHSSRRLTKGS